MYYTQPKKNYLAIFWEKFYICGHSFSLGQICVGKILNYISGAKFFFLGLKFILVWENLQSLFLGQILFLGGIFQVMSTEF